MDASRKSLKIRKTIAMANELDHDLSKSIPLKIAFMHSPVLRGCVFTEKRSKHTL
jgi:hypothetical protein